MKFPPTNKKHQDINSSFGENAVALEEHLKNINWHLFVKSYFAVFGIILVSIFALIIVIRAALAIF